MLFTGHRVLPLWIVLLMPVMVLASSESSRSAGAGVGVLLLVVLLYIEIGDKACLRVSVLLFYLLGIMRPLMIPTFGEILRQWCAQVGASPPLSGTHYGLQRHQGAQRRRVSTRPAESGMEHTPVEHWQTEDAGSMRNR